MLIEKKHRDFANGSVYCFALEDGKLIESTDTFLPFYTKDAIGKKQNKLDNYELSDCPEKNMCESLAYVEYVKSIFEYIPLDQWKGGIAVIKTP